MITLYDYQEVALLAIIEAFKTKNSALAVMATGLGKTIVAASWTKGELKNRQRGLFLCHDNGILDQAIIEFKKVLGSKRNLISFYGIESEKNFSIDKADITFASFQSLITWKDAMHEDEFDFIIVDESHHGQASTFKEVIQYFKPRKILGITATPNRADLKDIRELFGEEVVDLSLEEAIAKGWLTNIEYHILNDNLNHWKLKKIVKEVLEDGKRVSIKQLNETIFIKKRDEEIARSIQEYAGTTKKVIVFCERVTHADNFQKYLPNSMTYHSKDPGGIKENRSRLEAFREGSLQYIITVDKFNEGIDVPDAEVIVFLRCTDSRTIFYQQLGRGLRKIATKEKVIVLDFVANCNRLVMMKSVFRRVGEISGNFRELTREILHVSGAKFDFIFSPEQIDMLEVIKKINCRFVSDFPNLLAEYSSKNELPPEQATAGSQNKYIWNCSKCGHEWSARGQNRHRHTNSTGCPACAGYVPPRTIMHISSINPRIEKYFSINNKVAFKDITTRNSNENFLLACDTCDEEFWVYGSSLESIEVAVCNKCYKNNLDIAREEAEKKRRLEEIVTIESARKQCCVKKGKTVLPENQIEECVKCQVEESEMAEMRLEMARIKRDDDLRKRSYSTAKEAIESALRIGAVDRKSYQSLFKQDSKLPHKPSQIYCEDSFIGDCDTFFSKLKKMAK
ncbi:MAG: DEAD/DEAH box helicase family protein [bacterium]